MGCVANSFIFASRGSRGGSFLSVVDPEGFYVIMSLVHSVSSSFLHDPVIYSSPGE